MTKSPARLPASVSSITGGSIPARFFATRRTVEGFTPATIHLGQGDTEGKIEAVDPETPHPLPGLDASGCYILPGFIDLHIHGAAGHDTMDASPDALNAIARFVARHGVTGFLPTTMTAPQADILAALQAASRVVSQTVTGIDTFPASARVLGVHLEGPFLSPEYPGAQSPAALRPPALAEFHAYLDAGPIRLVTLAPELPGADAIIESALRRDVTVAIGHSGASYDQAQTAFDAGVRQATHTYNAMTGLHHRAPGVLGATLSDDRVFAQLIADGIHVHPAAMSILNRCKGVDRTLLVTDAMRATGLEAGRYELGGLPVIVENGTCRLESGALAGSVLTMDVALRNFMRATGLPLAAAWVCTSHTPACALGLDREYGAIEPGFAGDLVVVDEDLQVAATLVAGRVVYLRDAARLIE